LSVCFRGYLTKGTKKDADQNRIKIVKCLILNGARADFVTTDTKMSAMHWAAYNKDYAVIKALLNAGAPEFAFSHMGRLAIDIAGSSLAYEVIDICLDHYYVKVSGGVSVADAQDNSIIGFQSQIAGEQASMEQSVLASKPATGLAASPKVGGAKLIGNLERNVKASVDTNDPKAKEPDKAASSNSLGSTLMMLKQKRDNER
jgi:ankyrin repeat protein